MRAENLRQPTPGRPETRVAMEARPPPRRRSVAEKSASATTRYLDMWLPPASGDRWPRGKMSAEVKPKGTENEVLGAAEKDAHWPPPEKFFGQPTTDARR